jgi:hypothetical protein
MPPDLLYADPRFGSPEDVHMLPEQNCAFNHINHVDYTGSGRVTHTSRN